MTKLIKEAEILLPNVEDMTAFACVACDQFTSQPKYWEELEKLTENKPSALNLIFPEIYLTKKGDEKIEEINATMKEYLDKGIYKSVGNGYILTIRSTPFTKRRIGLIAALNLDEYSFKKGEKPLIRATEATIEERIPSRVKIRQNASIELPHIMMLIDDDKKEIIEGLYENREKYEKVYDFDLNQNGGHLTGYFIPKGDEFIKKFNKLSNKEELIRKYGKEEKFIIAVGDGNHSLATAKTCWENIKKNTPFYKRINHPQKYALVEIVNLYDEGLKFEPIYRYVTGVDAEKFLSELSVGGTDKTRVFAGDKEVEISFEDDVALGISKLDKFIKEYIAKNGGEVDYVHGEDYLKDLCKTNNAVGILIKPMDKNKLFKAVIENGSLPKKTFSMGEAEEKRYYLEGRKIIK